MFRKYIQNIVEKEVKKRLKTQSIPRSEGLLTSNRQDATQFLIDCLNDSFCGGIPSGFYYTPYGDLIKEVNKNMSNYGATIYTDKNIDILKFRDSFSVFSGLKIDVSLVSEPQPSSKAITYQFRNINNQWGGLKDVEIIGNEKNLIKEKGLGYTGIFWDSTTEFQGKYSKGECHFNEYDNIVFRFLNTGILISNNEKDNSIKASNSSHCFNIKGIGNKQLARFDKSGGNSILKYNGNNRVVLFEEEKEIAVVYVDADWIKIYPTFADMNKGKKEYFRKGIQVYANKYMLDHPNEKMHNTVYDLSNHFKEYIKDHRLNRLTYK